MPQLRAPQPEAHRLVAHRHEGGRAEPEHRRVEAKVDAGERGERRPGVLLRPVKQRGEHHIRADERQW